MARQMVINYGFSDIGPWSLLDQNAQSGDMIMRMMARSSVSENLQFKIDTAVRKIADEGYVVALAHIRNNREVCHNFPAIIAALFLVMQITSDSAELLQVRTTRITRAYASFANWSNIIVLIASRPLMRSWTSLSRRRPSAERSSARFWADTPPSQRRTRAALTPLSLQPKCLSSQPFVISADDICQ